MKKSNSLYYDYYASPIGLIKIDGNDDAITNLNFVETQHPHPQSHPLIEQTITQLEEYFNNNRITFDIPIQPHGTPFQQSVWQQLRTIPVGRVASYGDIAHAINNPKAVRAVGAANGQNPISIMLPCHRIIGSKGKLTGYGGGLWRKEWLLKHEGYLLL